MRKALGVLFSASAAVGLLALMPARAAAPVRIEKSLLGIRILGTYHDVLAKYGQPSLVIRNHEEILVERVKDAAGNDQGGIKDITYKDSGGSGGGPGGGPGMPGSGGGGASSGSGGALPPPPGFKKGGGMGGPGMPGSGGSGSVGGSGGSDTSDDSDTSFGATGGYGWIYKYPAQKLAYLFLFNLEGRVLVTVEMGENKGQPTSRGVKLGDNIKTLYEAYGWPDTIQEQDPGFVLDYGTKYHAKFAIIKNKIVGIAVVLEESQRIGFFPTDSSGSGGGPGGPGMPGSGGSGKRGGGASSGSGGALPPPPGFKRGGGGA